MQPYRSIPIATVLISLFVASFGALANSAAAQTPTTTATATPKVTATTPPKVTTTVVAPAGPLDTVVEDEGTGMDNAALLIILLVVAAIAIAGIAAYAASQRRGRVIIDVHDHPAGTPPH